MTTLTQESATKPQIEQISRVAQDAARKAVEDYGRFSKEGAQRVHGNPEFAVRVREATVLALADLSATDRFKDEEAKSNYTYPSSYKGPKPIEEQIKAVAKIFGLDPAQALEYAGNLPELPEGAEGWFAIPAEDAIARVHFPEVTEEGEKHCRVVRLVHDKVKASRPFYNWREGEITPEHLRVHARTAHALDLIAESQKGDILVIAAQLGMSHRGRSVRRARECFIPKEFGLGSFAVGCVILTHPERETTWEQLHMDCPGDEFAPVAGGTFSRAPFWYFVDSKVVFDTGRCGSADDSYGSASGFLSQ